MSEIICKNSRCNFWQVDGSDNCSNEIWDGSDITECSDFIGDDSRTSVTAPKNHIQENKQMPTLIPMDILLRYLEPAYREGLKKYYRESWRLGFPVSVMIDAAMRHIIEFFYEKHDFDPDAEKHGIVKHHLAGAIFSLLCVLQTLEKHPHLDDRFFLNTKPIDEDAQNAN